MEFEKLKTYLDGLYGKYGIPFCQCRVIRDGKVLFENQTGNLAKDRNLYFIYSMTKLVTSVAAMRLIEQGKLSLEDQVCKYLPQYREMTVEEAGRIREAGKLITVKHLLSMQGGYNYDIQDLEQAAKANAAASTLDLVNMLAKRPLIFEPGEGYEYSLCYDILGAVIEAASGISFGEYLEREIFVPLGMTETTVKMKDPMREKLVPLYTYDAESRTVKEMVPASNVYIFTTEYESGGAGIISTFDNYCRFVTTIVNDGVCENGYRLLTKESIEEIRKRRMTDEMLGNYVRYEPWGCGYAFGVRVLLKHSNCSASIPIGSFELTGAAGSYAFFDMENKTGIVYFQHVLGVEAIPEIVHHQIRELVYEEIAGHKEK